MPGDIESETPESSGQIAELVQYPKTLLRYYSKQTL